MIYLDYSATTPVDSRVLECFKNFYNVKKDNYNDLENDVRKSLGTSMDVIFTTGSTEANNMAILGVCKKYKSGHIITTKLEHSSVLETCKYLEKHGFIVDYVPLIDGVVDIDSLKEMIHDDTVLVSIASVSSEIGILQPINEIAKLLKHYPNVTFHCDMTQSIGKVNIPFDDIDLISFSGHKIYGLKGIGCLLKRKDLKLEPIIFGKRLFNYGMVKSFVLALELIIPNVDTNYFKVLEYNKMICEELAKYSNVVIHNKNTIPHILNISILNWKPETFLHALEGRNVFISTKSACSSTNDYSLAVYSYSNSLEEASHSVRISLSYLTTLDEVKEFLEAFSYCMKTFI